MITFVRGREVAMRDRGGGIWRSSSSGDRHRFRLGNLEGRFAGSSSDSDSSDEMMIGLAFVLPLDEYSFQGFSLAPCDCSKGFKPARALCGLPGDTITLFI